MNHTIYLYHVKYFINQGRRHDGGRVGSCPTPRNLSHPLKSSKPILFRQRFLSFLLDRYLIHCFYKPSSLYFFLSVVWFICHFIYTNIYLQANKQYPHNIHVTEVQQTTRVILVTQEKKKFEDKRHSKS